MFVWSFGVFLFKQKTAYEMRISDWSSDVGSSDLEGLEHAVQHRLDGGEDVVLGDEAHLEVELVELARRAVGAAVLVAKAGRDLEVAVEAGDHQMLLEHLRRLRQRVELDRVQAARHQVVARDLRSEEHTSALIPLMLISSAVFRVKNKNSLKQHPNI